MSASVMQHVSSSGASFSSDTPRSASMPGRSPSDSAARRGLPARAASPKRPSGCRTCARSVSSGTRSMRKAGSTATISSGVCAAAHGRSASSSASSALASPSTSASAPGDVGWASARRWSAEELDGVRTGAAACSALSCSVAHGGEGPEASDVSGEGLVGRLAEGTVVRVGRAASRRRTAGAPSRVAPSSKKRRRLRESARGRASVSSKRIRRSGSALAGRIGSLAFASGDSRSQSAS
mmetsp:Transcript_48553/g.156309  ORF Transcript_48553/g.156309 Transcript_48553/m.156309 type:complete len:238 (-) Transcript_48553:1291-2004(-)